MQRSALAVLLLFVAACEGSPGVRLGEPQLRVVSGTDQVHAAAQTDSLDAPVEAQLYQTPEGGITFRLVPELHAQTGVVGVAGEQVCAVPVGNGQGLQPWNPCDITDGEGVAEFFFEVGTTAGVHCAEVRAIVDGQKTVTDEVCATVEAGPVDLINVVAGSFNLRPEEAHYFTLSSFKDRFANNIPFSVTTSGTTLGVVTRTAHGGETEYGVTLLEGAVVGSTETLHFIRAQADTLLTATATVVESQTPNTWAFEIERHTS